MRRFYTYLGAALFISAGVVVAIVLPHRCFEVSGACPIDDISACGTICSGASVLLRAGVAGTGLVLAVLVGLVARRT